MKLQDIDFKNKNKLEFDIMECRPVAWSWSVMGKRGTLGNLGSIASIASLFGIALYTYFKLIKIEGL